MKRSTMLTVVLAFVCCLLSANSIKAQAVSGYTSIDYYSGTNIVDAYSETDSDFDLQGDYDAKVVMEVMDQNNNVVNNRVYSNQSNTGLAFVDVQFSGTSGYTYTAIAHHWAVANLWDYNYEYYPYQTVWFDDFYLGSFESIGINERWYYYFLSPGFLQMERNVSNIDLGGTYDSASTTLPFTINSILPARGVVGATIGIAIFGSGFNTNSTPTVAISGSGVTASEVHVSSSGEITANINITRDAATGNHAVKVVSSGFSSNSVTFFVQVPTSLRRDSLSDIIEISNGDVVDGLGVLRLSGQCGAYRNVVYQLMDQKTPEPQPIAAALEVDETFSNYQGPTNLNPGLLKTGETRYDGKIADVIGVVDSSPHCPGALTLSFNQGFVALIGTRSYILTTTNSVGISYDLADWVINVNMTHP
jgi:hypothetical protein